MKQLSADLYEIAFILILAIGAILTLAIVIPYAAVTYAQDSIKSIRSIGSKTLK